MGTHQKRSRGGVLGRAIDGIDCKRFDAGWRGTPGHLLRLIPRSQRQKSVTHPGAQEARLEELLFPGVERRLEMLHLHASAWKQRRCHTSAFTGPLPYYKLSEKTKIINPVSMSGCAHHHLSYSTTNPWVFAEAYGRLTESYRVLWPLLNTNQTATLLAHRF